jgi:hypothetical protein
MSIARIHQKRLLEECDKLSKRIIFEVATDFCWEKGIQHLSRIDSINALVVIPIMNLSLTLIPNLTLTRIVITFIVIPQVTGL